MRMMRQWSPYAVWHTVWLVCSTVHCIASTAELAPRQGKSNCSMSVDHINFDLDSNEACSLNEADHDEAESDRFMSHDDQIP